MLHLQAEEEEEEDDEGKEEIIESEESGMNRFHLPEKTMGLSCPRR